MPRKKKAEKEVVVEEVVEEVKTTDPNAEIEDFRHKR